MSVKHPANARQKGQARKRRVHRAWRRAQTAEIRHAHNDAMRAAGHPGWIERPWGSSRYR